MTEMQAPEQIAPQSLGDYLEVMSKAAFQAGISWRVIESKWPGIWEAFHGFDAERVADMTEPELAAVAYDTRVLRECHKLEAVVSNANRMVELAETHGSFQSYLRSHADFQATVKDLRKQFKFLGDFGCYYFLHVVGEEVPSHEEWTASRGR